MNSNKIKQFIKNYGFYVAVALIAVGAVVTVFLFPNDGKVANQPNPYTKGKEVTSSKVDSVKDSKQDIVLESKDTTTNSKDTTTDKSKEEIPTVAKVADPVKPKDQKIGAKEEPSIVSGKETITSENFDTTTVKAEKEPYFTEGDTLNLPIEGEIVVPYTDDSTSSWFSESLKETIRTYGICIKAKQGDIVKAAAKGTVVDIIADSSATNKHMPNVGVEVVLEHGNGIQTKYGLQGGQAYKDLLGKVVETGDPIGEVGKPSGAFISKGTNIYFQVIKDGEVINPKEMLQR